MSLSVVECAESVRPKNVIQRKKKKNRKLLRRKPKKEKLVDKLKHTCLNSPLKVMDPGIKSCPWMLPASEPQSKMKSSITLTPGRYVWYKSVQQCLKNCGIYLSMNERVNSDGQ